MHIALAVITVLIAWHWGDWKNWQKYNATMIFMAMGNLFYNFIYAEHYLWQFKPDILLNFKLTEILYTFIIFPCTVLLFLNEYPQTLKKQIFRIAKFIFIYITFEYVFYLSGRMVYDNGWNTGWSLAWNCMMFPILAVHYKKPLVAYILSAMMGSGIVILFPPLMV